MGRKSDDQGENIMLHISSYADEAREWIEEIRANLEKEKIGFNSLESKQNLPPYGAVFLVHTWNEKEAKNGVKIMDDLYKKHDVYRDGADIIITAPPRMQPKRK